MTTPRLVSLTHEQMNHVYIAAGILDQRDGGRSSSKPPSLLPDTHAELGDGVVRRCIASGVSSRTAHGATLPGISDDAGARHPVHRQSLLRFLLSA